MRYVALLASVLAMTACQKEVACRAPQETPTAQLPTAAEVFHMRTECAQFGDKILNDDIIGAALTKSVATNYDPQDNRCYVDLTASTADLTVPFDSPTYDSDSVLYDGQTHELLASIRINNGKKVGMAFKGNPRPYGFDAVSAYIDSKMGD